MGVFRSVPRCFLIPHNSSTKPFPVSGKRNLRSGGPSSQQNVKFDGRLRKTLSMNLPRIQLEIYELWKTCRVPASCDFQPRILLSANKTWRQHNAWLAANELNYEAGVWRGRKRRNNWGARERVDRARRKGRSPFLLLFLTRPYSLFPFHYSFKCLLHRLQFRGVNRPTLVLLGVVQLKAISKTGRVRKRTRWKREQERTGTLSSLLPRPPLTYWRALIPPLLPFKCLTQATNQGGGKTKLNTTWCN